MMGRKRRLALNSISSLVHQMTTLLCGFIVPRLILSHFGTEVNGLVNSITQFLAAISFLELGIGAVVQSSLYKPLSEKNYIQVSQIITSANKFFKHIAVILVVYIAALIVIYPSLVISSFDSVYIIVLILCMSVSFFSQFYFGVVDRILLTADQRGYIQFNAQTITLIINTIACALLIELGLEIHVVKLATSIIYLARPIALRMYVNKHYNVDRKIYYQVEPIKQKWNGIAQHIAAVVLDQTDTIVLTIFSTLSNVSIYGVYYLVISGVKNVFMSLTSGLQALLGELWAKQELEEMKATFLWGEWAIHTGVVIVFGCVASLITPFVLVYTYGVNDADYNVPVFAVLITLANGMHCLRLPYNIMILAGGHYRQTQSNYIIAAVMNIVISVVTVKIWGLIGVAIGTLCAMIYQTVWMAWYDSINFLQVHLKEFYKHLFVDFLCFVVAYGISSFLEMGDISYLSWIWLSLKICFIWLGTTICLNCLFYKKYMFSGLKFIKKRFGKH